MLRSAGACICRAYGSPESRECMTLGTGFLASFGAGNELGALADAMSITSRSATVDGIERQTRLSGCRGPPAYGGFGRDACRNRLDLIACSSIEVSAGTSAAPRYRKLYRKCWALVVVALPTVPVRRLRDLSSRGRRELWPPSGVAGRNQPGAVPSAFSQPRPRMGQSLNSPCAVGLMWRGATGAAESKLL